MTFRSGNYVTVDNQQSGVLHGHDELRHFFLKGTAGRPNELVRWYRTGQYMFDGCTLIWEYPRQAPEFEQVDLVEVMELVGPRIAGASDLSGVGAIRGARQGLCHSEGV